jgi:uncharacterized protein YegP (UPF0339 family)
MFEIWKSSRVTTQPYFWTLKGRNGEKLCTSEMYVSKQGAQTGIAAVKSVAPNAPTYDRT